jgi:hypothetical protein
LRRRWTLAQLEEALESTRTFGNEILVADSLNVLGETGEVATVYFHFVSNQGTSDQAKYHFTFDNRQSLDANFALLWKCVESFRKMEPRPASVAATR